MSIQKTEAIVLNTYDLRETSLIANFYTRSFGKMSGVLKGIRQEPQKFASTLEPFSYNDVIFYLRRNSSLHLISQCDIKDNFSGLRQNIFKVGLASFMMELLEAICPKEDKNEDIFDLALMTLGAMEKNSDADKIAMIFKIKLLSLSGFKPHFDSCVSCDAKITGQSKFSLVLGGLLCPACYKRDLSSRLVFRGTVASILYIEKSDFRNNLSLGMNPQIKKELDILLNSFLNFHLGKELKSQKVLRKISNLALVSNR